jgi:hypothetical protein
MDTNTTNDVSNLASFAKMQRLVTAGHGEGTSEAAMTFEELVTAGQDARGRGGRFLNHQPDLAEVFPVQPSLASEPVPQLLLGLRCGSAKLTSPLLDDLVHPHPTNSASPTVRALLLIVVHTPVVGVVAQFRSCIQQEKTSPPLLGLRLARTTASSLLALPRRSRLPCESRWIVVFVARVLNGNQEGRRAPQPIVVAAKQRERGNA